jgi:hypothetical protein
MILHVEAHYSIVLHLTTHPIIFVCVCMCMHISILFTDNIEIKIPILKKYSMKQIQMNMKNNAVAHYESETCLIKKASRLHLLTGNIKNKQYTTSIHWCVYRCYQLHQHRPVK